MPLTEMTTGTTVVLAKQAKENVALIAKWPDAEAITVSFGTLGRGTVWMYIGPSDADGTALGPRLSVTLEASDVDLLRTLFTAATSRTES